MYTVERKKRMSKETVRRKRKEAVIIRNRGRRRCQKERKSRKEVL